MVWIELWKYSSNLSKYHDHDIIEQSIGKQSAQSCS